MDDDLAADDRGIGKQIRELVVAGAPPRDARQVAEMVFTRPLNGWTTRLRTRLGSHLLVFASLSMLVASLGVAGYYLAEESASGLARAVVNGDEYTVTAARSLRVPPDLLSLYGTASHIDQVQDVAGMTVYAIEGVDPTQALVIRLKPGQGDDAGPLGSYLLLVRGADAFTELCPFFDRASEATPRACRER